MCMERKTVDANEHAVENNATRVSKSERERKKNVATHEIKGSLEILLIYFCLLTVAYVTKIQRYLFRKKKKKSMMQ